jgi:hypothetical protein
MFPAHGLFEVHWALVWALDDYRQRTAILGGLKAAILPRKGGNKAISLRFRGDHPRFVVSPRLDHGAGNVKNVAGRPRLDSSYRKMLTRNK